MFELSPRVIGAVHVALSVLRNFYVFLIPATFVTAYNLDYIYLAFFFIVPFSWLCFRGECLITYIAKKIEDPAYVMGADPTNIKDMVDIFPDKKYYDIFIHLNNIFYAISLFIVNERTLHLPQNVIIAIIIIGFIAREFIPLFFEDK